MSGYRDFSAFYDGLMADVDYAAYADYLLTLFEQHAGVRPQTLLDLACGSGSLASELHRRGVDIIGVDASAEMLQRAVEKIPTALWLCQDMRQLDLYGTVDGTVCTLDSLNHLCRTADVAEVFRRVRLFTEPHGLFVFDVNTPYKHRAVLGDRAFVLEEENVLCAWRTHYTPRTQQVTMQLDFFAACDDGRYERYEECVRERAYSERTLRRLLAQTGWETLAVYGEGRDTAPTDTDERMVFVARSTRTVSEARGIL